MPQERDKKRYAKPLPHIDEENRPWWEAVQRHELYIQKCRDCGDLRFHPRALCTNCLSSNTEWVKCKGSGRIYTFTVTNQNQASGFRDSLPYVLAWVQLDEGPKLMTNIVDCPPERVKIDMPVEAVFDDVTPEVTLVKFRPATARS
ncbi:MAG TPA: Zn-ribbon domain-containing OB-fold protein [Candidatus Binataceae bacterium]|nr:Zn-ribbon domain-containing OB-fold protein [Candidatus Binataceae bacterium]